MSRKKHAKMAEYREKNAQKKPLERQLHDALKQKCAFGTSKHEDAKNGVNTFDKIYSHSTFDNYFKEGKLFLKWCQERHHEVRTLEDCREYQVGYVRDQIERGMSASTIKKRAAALGKIYGESVLDRVETPVRHRSEITRSREVVENDLRFQGKSHEAFKEFCRSTGLRRHEFAQLTTGMLVRRPEGLYIEGVKGKGGKLRDIPVHGNEELVQKMMSDPKKYFSKLDTHEDIHSYRSEYACRVYRANARELDTLDRKDVYCCRGDMAGIHFDKQALQSVSWALGHNRIEICASNYLYNLSSAETAVEIAPE